MKHANKTILILLVVFLLAVPATTKAQRVQTKGLFNIGIEGGVQFTNIKDFSPVYQAKSKTGYRVGGFAEYFVVNDVKLHAGIYYDDRAFQLASNFPFVDSPGKILKSYYFYQVDYKLNYLTLPLSIIYQRGGEKFKINLQAGIYYSIFLNATLDGAEDVYVDPDDVGLVTDSTLSVGHNQKLYSGSTMGIATRSDTTESFYFNSYDFGFNFLIGVIYNITPQIGISAGVGFTYSISSVFENPEVNSKWLQNTHVNLGFVYTLKKSAKKNPLNKER